MNYKHTFDIVLSVELSRDNDKDDRQYFEQVAEELRQELKERFFTLTNSSVYVADYSIKKNIDHYKIRVVTGGIEFNTLPLALAYEVVRDKARKSAATLGGQSAVYIDGFDENGKCVHSELFKKAVFTV
jgi:hypothetical protein